jgi:hypothetical protein
MKKTWLIAAALAAISIPGAAWALPVNLATGLRAIEVDGTPLTLGTLSINLALGARLNLATGANLCRYLATWRSPLNPSNAQTCFLDEIAQPFSPSCVANSVQFVDSVVNDAPTIGCRGFDAMGQPQSVTLVLGESAATPTVPGRLQGLALVGPLNAVYPITIR